MEWVFGDITSYFAFLDFKKNLKVGLSPVGKMYAVCALLRNAITCLMVPLQVHTLMFNNPLLRNIFMFEGLLSLLLPGLFQRRSLKETSQRHQGSTSYPHIFPILPKALTIIIKKQYRCFSGIILITVYKKLKILNKAWVAQ